MPVDNRNYKPTFINNPHLCVVCGHNCEAQRINKQEIIELEEAFEKLQQISPTVLSTHLTGKLFNNIKNRLTKYGSTLLDCIKSGVERHEHSIGIFAPDPLAYVTFKPLFHEIIKEFHKGYDDTLCHPSTNWGDISEPPVVKAAPAPKGKPAVPTGPIITRLFTNMDPEGMNILSTQLICVRNLDGYEFLPKLSEEHLLEIEERINNALANLSKEYKGKYTGYNTLTDVNAKKLVKQELLFDECDAVMLAAGFGKFWPQGRGYFMNKTKDFLVWINEADHLKIICRQKGGNLMPVYVLLVKAIAQLDSQLKFVRCDEYGYLTVSPTNLGTTITASVVIDLPFLSANIAEFEKLIDENQLQIIKNIPKVDPGKSKEPPKEFFYEIGSKRKLGVPEFTSVKDLETGIMNLIAQERILSPVKKK